MEEPISAEQPIEPVAPRRLASSQTFSAMRHRNFQLYFGGQLISNIGTWMQIIAQGWVVYQLGHSEVTLGLVAFASAIPTLAISPWGGVVVDRVSRRGLLLLTQSSSMLLAFVMAALTFTGAIREWHVIVLAALLGVVNAFDAPARQAFVPEMVGKEDLPNAIALNSMMFNSARVIGPALVFYRERHFLPGCADWLVADETATPSNWAQHRLSLAAIAQGGAIYCPQPRTFCIDSTFAGI